MKEIYDYLTLRTEEGFPLYKLRNLYLQIDKLKKKIDECEKKMI